MKIIIGYGPNFNAPKFQKGDINNMLVSFGVYDIDANSISHMNMFSTKFRVVLTHR